MSSILPSACNPRVRLGRKDLIELRRMAKIMKRPMSKVVALLIEHWNDCPLIRDPDSDDGGIVADSLLAPP